MAAFDAGHRQPRDALPPINQLDFNHYRSEKAEHPRLSTVAALNTTTSHSGSPTTMYSGPPPPYSYAPSTTVSTQGLTGYVSPPESNSRRSTREEKESPTLIKSLPSISEALKHADVPLNGSTNQQPHGQRPDTTPMTAGPQSFPDAPKGPGNPFSQLAPSMKTTGEHFAPRPEAVSTPTIPPPPPPSGTEPRHRNQPFQFPVSPRTSTSVPRPSFGSFSTSLIHADRADPHSASQAEPSRPAYPFPEVHTHHHPVQPPSNSSFAFEPAHKFDAQRNPFQRAPSNVPYSETVKRHLEVFDAEVALTEVGESSARTSDLSKQWIQHYHQSNRASFYAEGLPPVHEIDEVMRETHRMLENLNRIRDVVLAQQNALSEQRAREEAMGEQVANHPLNTPGSEHKSGGFAGGDAKKRRGKAAPPGRCHSCN